MCGGAGLLKSESYNGKMVAPKLNTVVVASLASDRLAIAACSALNFYSPKPSPTFSWSFRYRKLKTRVMLHGGRSMLFLCSGLIDELMSQYKSFQGFLYCRKCGRIKSVPSISINTARAFCFSCMLHSVTSECSVVSPVSKMLLFFETCFCSALP